MTFDTGGMFSGPGRGIEDAMGIAHLDDTCNCLGSLIRFPNTFKMGLPVLVEARYRIREPWSVGVLFGRSLIGQTSGYHDPFQFVDVDYAVTSVAAVLSAGPRSFQIGLGPALHIARSRRGASEGGQPPAWSDQSKVGFIAQARVTVPAGSRVFLDLTLQYHFVGRVVVGPYSDSGGVGFPVTFPPTSVQYNHWFVGAGPGLRF
jgi:hypothetical protein